MSDEGNLVPESDLTLSDQAVLYLLRRIRVDANLRWYMLHTEAFAKLCSAEAARIGSNADAVMEKYSRPAEHCTDDRADAETLTAMVDDLRKKVAHNGESPAKREAPSLLAQKIRERCEDARHGSTAYFVDDIEKILAE